MGRDAAAKEKEEMSASAEPAAEATAAAVEPAAAVAE